MRVSSRIHEVPTRGILLRGMLLLRPRRRERFLLQPHRDFFPQKEQTRKL